MTYSEEKQSNASSLFLFQDRLEEHDAKGPLRSDQLKSREARERAWRIKYSKHEGAALIPGTHVKCQAWGYMPIISVLKKKTTDSLELTSQPA